MRSFSQSSSVFGIRSTVPLFVVTILTESKILSDAGSSTYRMSSFTETTGFISPHIACAVGAAGAGVGGFGDEHDNTLDRPSMPAQSPNGRLPSWEFNIT